MTMPPERFNHVTSINGRLYAMAADGKIYVADRGESTEVIPVAKGK